VLLKSSQSPLFIRTFVLPGATTSNHEAPRNTTVSSPVNAQLMPKLMPKIRLRCVGFGRFEDDVSFRANEIET
jgi:hypothetical protein